MESNFNLNQEDSGMIFFFFQRTILDAGRCGRVEVWEVVKGTSQLGPPLLLPGNLDALGGFWETGCWDS